MQTEKKEKIKKESTEVIQEAVKEVTGKTIEELRKEQTELDAKINQLFYDEYNALCQKYNRQVIQLPGQYVVSKLK